MSSQHSPSVDQAVERLGEATNLRELLHATCTELVVLLDAGRCAISRAVGDLLIEVTQYQPTGATPQLDLYLASDYPLTLEVLEQGEPRTVSLADADADPSEADLLRQLGFSALLMLPLRAGESSWGLVEVYTTERPFAEPDVVLAQALVTGAEDVLAQLEVS